MTDPLVFARRLVEQGMPVFVARADAGSPTGFRLPLGWQATKCDPRLLEKWMPGDALCAVGGHALDIVDVDPRNGGSVDTLTRGNLLPETYAIVRTPSGGVHFYVAKLGIAKCSRDGIDLQAGAENGTGRGFAFLPGTVRASKVDGVARPYELAADNLDRFGMDDDTGVALKAWLAAPKLPAQGTSPDGSLVLGPAGEREGLGSPIEDSHDATLAAYTASLVRRGLERAEAWLVVQGRIRDVVGGDPRWPFAEADFERWWSGASKKFAPRELPAEPEVDPVTGERVWPWVDWRQIASQPPEPVEWLVPGLLAARRGHLVFSETGIGKSLLTHELSLAIVRGGEALGVRCRKGVVLIVDHENDPRGDTWDHLRCMGATAEELDDLRVLSFPEMDPLDVASGGQYVLEAALAVGADLVVFDTATRTVKGEENSNDTWAAWDRHTGARLRAAGIAFLRLDHAGKDSSRGVRGGSNKSSDVDLSWELTKDSDTEFRLVNRKSRILLPNPVIAFERRTEPRLYSAPITADVVSVKIRAQTALWEALDRLEVPGDAGRPTCELKLKGAGISFNTNTLTEVVRARKAQMNAFATRPDWAPDPARGGLILGQGSTPIDLTG